MKRVVACLLLAACGSRAPKVAPRWLVARADVAATDDASVRLRRGFGVQAVETRGDAARSSEGHWFPLASLEPVASMTTPARAPLPERAVARPPELGDQERWIDVDIAAQRLVAYEGERAVRAMRISSGVGEEGAFYSTPRGTFRIYAKLRAATMASAPPAAGEPPDAHPYRFEGVPDVQYFYKEVALHGAYWHRRFGERVSHGCVNLAPVDAAWLFDFTEPHVGGGERERAGRGTIVRVR